MAIATPQSLSTASDQVNSVVDDGLPSQSSDGIQANCDSHTRISIEDKSMPIAVVGIGCRFPGDATSPDKLWKLISEGRSAHSAFPKDRFNIDAFYHPAAERQGTVSDQTTRLYT